MSVPSPKGHPRREVAKRGTFRSEEVSVEPVAGSSKPGYNQKRDDAADGFYWAC